LESNAYILITMMYIKVILQKIKQRFTWSIVLCEGAASAGVAVSMRDGSQSIIHTKMSKDE
jgi:hypothetical protein